jgi:hypothetical protein
MPAQGDSQGDTMVQQDGDSVGIDEPSMLEQTIELAKVLRTIADRDPEGHPSESAVSVFHNWLRAARELTEEPQYFDDILENYDAAGRTNRDLQDIFDILHPYVEIIDDRPYEEDEPEHGKPGKVFIGLPTF